MSCLGSDSGIASATVVSAVAAGAVIVSRADAGFASACADTGAEADDGSGCCACACGSACASASVVIMLGSCVVYIFCIDNVCDGLYSSVGFIFIPSST